MSVPGRVENGVIVLQAGVQLPEGAEVVVSFSSAPTIHQSPVQKRVELPLVRTGKPGTVCLSNDQIAEILNEQDSPVGR